MLEHAHQPVQTTVFDSQSKPSELIDFAPPKCPPAPDLSKFLETSWPMPVEKPYARTFTNSYVSVLPKAPDNADISTYSAILAAEMFSAGFQPPFIEIKGLSVEADNKSALENNVETPQPKRSLRDLAMKLFNAISESARKIAARTRKAIAHLA